MVMAQVWDDSLLNELLAQLLRQPTRSDDSLERVKYPQIQSKPECNIIFGDLH